MLKRQFHSEKYMITSSFCALSDRFRVRRDRKNVRQCVRTAASPAFMRLRLAFARYPDGYSRGNCSNQAHADQNMRRNLTWIYRSIAQMADVFGSTRSFAGTQ